jgi:hypothetical protein
VITKGNISVFQTILGGGLCCLSSFYYIWDKEGVPNGDGRFYLALIGQAITGIGVPFIIGVPTKVRNNPMRDTITIVLCRNYMSLRKSVINH